MPWKLYADLPILTQAEADQRCAAWIAVHFRDLNEAIESSWRLDHAQPLGRVPWMIECDGGQRLEHHEIRQRKKPS
jgi:hypothetical protein